MADTTPFEVQYKHAGNLATATVRPCCNDNNIVDFAIWQEDKMLFTMTRDMVNRHHWSIALKNADDEFDDELIQQIGAAIEQHQSS